MKTRTMNEHAESLYSKVFKNKKVLYCSLTKGTCFAQYTDGSYSNFLIYSQNPDIPINTIPDCRDVFTHMNKIHNILKNTISNSYSCSYDRVKYIGYLFIDSLKEENMSLLTEKLFNIDPVIVLNEGMPVVMNFEIIDVKTSALFKVNPFILKDNLDKKDSVLRKIYLESARYYIDEPEYFQQVLHNDIFNATPEEELYLEVTENEWGDFYDIKGCL